MGLPKNGAGYKEMAFLDFIKNRDQQPAQQAAKPETAKEMYSREAAQEKANRIDPTPEQVEKAQKIGETLRKATQHIGNDNAPQADASSNGSQSSPAAEMQKQNGQDKAQAALSPTDNASGKTARRNSKRLLKNLRTSSRR